MTNEMIDHFYLTNHDFQVMVNKDCQAYNKTPQEMFATATEQEKFKEMLPGGCNAERSAKQ